MKMNVQALRVGPDGREAELTRVEIPKQVTRSAFQAEHSRGR